jgi:26S proteasome regulatory subunit T1
LKRVNELAGIKESDTGLAPPALWDLAADKQALSGTIISHINLINV